MGRGINTNQPTAKHTGSLDANSVIFSASFSKQRKRADELEKLQIARDRLDAARRRELQRPPSHIDNKENKYWYDEDNKLHREGDLPAVERENGKKEYYIHGVKHRDLGPAVESANGLQQMWFQNGKLNSVDDKPAIVGLGAKEWLKDNQHHRSDDLPAIITDSGKKEWWLNGKRHRPVENGPAVIHEDGTEEYWLNDERIEP